MLKENDNKKTELNEEQLDKVSGGILFEEKPVEEENEKKEKVTLDFI